MKFLLSLAVAVLFTQAAWAEVASMVGRLRLAGEGKTFPEGTTVNIFREESKTHFSVPVDAAGNFVVEGLEAGEKLRLTVPVDYEITAVSAPFVLDAKEIARNPMNPHVTGLASPEITVDLIWKDRQTKWAEMRRGLARTISEGFFKAAKLTPEQQELFITVRLESETRVLQEVKAHPGSTLLPGALMADFSAALQKNFGEAMARQYREYQQDQLGWGLMQGSTALQANEWLTGEEQAKLVRVWGPILFASMDRTFDKKFEAASREEKLAFFDELRAAYISAARGILDDVKLAKLQERLAEMRKLGIAELDEQKATK